MQVFTNLNFSPLFNFLRMFTYSIKDCFIDFTVLIVSFRSYSIIPPPKKKKEKKKKHTPLEYVPTLMANDKILMIITHLPPKNNPVSL